MKYSLSTLLAVTGIVGVVCAFGRTIATSEVPPADACTVAALALLALVMLAAGAARIYDYA